MFWGAATHADNIEFLNFLMKLKNQRSGSKTVRGGWGGGVLILEF